MDIELLKTYLEVQRTLHFGRAAENLFVSQSTVSARIRQLEESLGVTLFVRERHNIRLTSAGARLRRHAETILASWSRARQELAVDETNGASVAVGGVPSLWDILLQGWLQRVNTAEPHLALTAEVHPPELLLRRLNDRALDLAFTFEPPQADGVAVREVARIPLLLVATRAGLGPAEALGPGYVLVDWGTSFAGSHARHYPDIPSPRLRLSLGRIALGFILARGGAAYLAEPMVANAVAAGRLHRVVEAPVITRTAYAAYPEAGEAGALAERLLHYCSAAGNQPN